MSKLPIFKGLNQFAWKSKMAHKSLQPTFGHERRRTRSERFLDSTGKEYFVSGFVQGSRPSRKPCAICSRRQYPSQPPFCSHFKQFPSPSLLKAILSTSSLIFRSTCFPTMSSSHYSKVYNYYTLTTQCSYALGSVCCVF